MTALARRRPVPEAWARILLSIYVSVALALPR